MTHALRPPQHLTLKQLGCYASLNRYIYISADPTPVDVEHACHCIVPHNVYSENHDDPPTFKWRNVNKPIFPALGCFLCIYKKEWKCLNIFYRTHINVIPHPLSEFEKKNSSQNRFKLLSK